ncbi:MAG: glycoside hydrolase, end-alpha-1,4-polygalactosaminidase [Crocinitomix sp.]|nr:glycoside hydrolase, end-alpha-1,4-polygalactosaminidase [Crocinitomix sp.]
MIIKIRVIFVIALLISFILACNKEKNTPYTSATLNGVEVSTFMYQIQHLDDNTEIDELAATDYDMLIVEPGFNFTESPYDINYLVDNLKTKSNGDNRILLAYIDIGQAEDYRTYWEDDWVAPTVNASGSPDFLVTIDPDGWSGNYPVAYWDTLWQNIWLKDGGLIDQITAYGFDGVYLDWVEAYDDDLVREYANTKGKNTESEMMSFISGIKEKGKDSNANFLVVAQNAPYLLDANPALYASIIDAIATEDTWFYGEGDSEWDDPEAGDIKGGERHEADYSTKNRIIQSEKYLDLGIPVFTVDYCLSSRNAKSVYRKSRKYGFIPLVTQVSLSAITDTPPF